MHSTRGFECRFNIASERGDSRHSRGGLLTKGLNFEFYCGLGIPGAVSEVSEVCDQNRDEDGATPYELFETLSRQSPPE